jgi:hypothetical protein
MRPTTAGDNVFQHASAIRVRIDHPRDVVHTLAEKRAILA